MRDHTFQASAGSMMIFPSVGVWKIGNELYFDRKFHDGVIAYTTYWPGSIYLAIRLVNTTPPEFGLVQYDAEKFPAEVIVIKSDELIPPDVLGRANIVLASGDSFDNLNLASICKQQGIKCVYGIEYTLQTRLQIEVIKDSSIWQKFKTIVWLLLKERKRLQAFRLSDGIQANGVPAYDSYASLAPTSLLYFDTRNTVLMGVTDEELSTRLAYLDGQAPLRLGFSGRLASMKGADHLIEIAYELQKRQIRFSFDIFGTGELFTQMQERIEKYGLTDFVMLRGVVDFASELVPFIKSKLDVFVCCHRQSDPSCTYLETYACGVPIVGYNNRAHQGILDLHDVGWSVAMNDIEGIVNLIAKLNMKRSEIKIKAINAASFARKHTFEATFQRRISHCIEILEL